ncbi:hypothetical protein ETAA8_66600 [Anatilimnocola aggregata]|uniref:DUF1501 domain-containing protein n=1 Tax=Anatilimnocola aggregata TaxID=2528021 RepID=A0A517YMR4_9BACT|nr:DUF1501 domain-containing protein [Anatilimnocola aggregata]QDU31501.1 hypothetical protein ETAA8_66600 [Anatilimnocola aggregata]
MNTFSTNRRDFLRQAGGGLGALALASLLADQAVAAGSKVIHSQAAKKPHHAPQAKSVIWLFMDGGPSHIDLFDPKPALTKYAGKPLPASFKKPQTAMGVTANTPLLASTRKFKQHGDCGLWVSDLYPAIAQHADELCLLQGCQSEGLTHVNAVCQMNTCSQIAGRPSLGAWAMYGLGSENADLPGFVVLTDYSTDPPGGNQNWNSGFMPATYQGTRLATGKTPILYAEPPPGVSDPQQRGKIDFINGLSRRFAQKRTGEDRLDAHIASYELAFRMQSSAPEVADFSRESAETLAMYGFGNETTQRNARNCLLARRLVERGVRFVQLYMGSGTQWDAHANLDSNHEANCAETDQPIAALLADLKRRGLLDSTLVVWGGEFGRTPMSESGNGRDHNPYGFTCFMAGGGVKPGFRFGGTDEIGLWATSGHAHVRDLHATILHLLGANEEALTFLHDGRDERATFIGGHVLKDIIA